MTEPEVGANLAWMLWRTAGRHGGRAALLERDGTRVDYGALCARAAAIGGALLAAGVASEDPVAILLERGVDAAAAFFGCLAVGAIAVLVNEALRPRQIEHMLGHAGARYLLSTADLLGRQPRPLRSGFRVLDVATIGPIGGHGIVPVPRCDGHVAQIIYTSGSTGLPKGVAVSHGNLRAAARAVTSYLQIGADDRIASFLPFSFVYGLNQLLCAASTGATLVVDRSPLPQENAATLRSHQVTILPAVPPLWHRLLATAAFRDARLPALRVMTNAGGHLPVAAVRALRRVQPHAALFLMYGLTEALRSTYLPPEEVDRRPDSIGRAIPGAEVLLLGEDGRPVATGEIGELVHRGPTVTLGYWKDPALTASVFRANPARPPGAPDSERVVFTGDLARRDADGFLYYVARKDRIIKTMGYRVGPDEVSDVLSASGEVTEAAVMGEPDEVWGARIAAFVVLAPTGSLDRLKAYCARELPRFMQPARYDVRAALPLLPSGKHDLAALRAEPLET